MNITKTYEKINQYISEHIYEIYAANVDGGSVYTIDRYVMYYLPGLTAWTARTNQTNALYNLYNSIFTENYRRGKAIPGKIGNRCIIKISNAPDGGNTYISKKFTKLLPAGTEYYTIPEKGQLSPVLAGVYQDNQFYVFAVIMPHRVPDEQTFKPAVTV